MTELLRSLARPARLTGYALAVLVASWALGSLARLGLLEYGPRAWWAAVAVVSFAAAVAVTFPLVAPLQRAAQSTFPWWRVGLHVGAWLLCLAYFGSVIAFIAVHEFGLGIAELVR